MHHTQSNKVMRKTSQKRVTLTIIHIVTSRYQKTLSLSTTDSTSTSSTWIKEMVQSQMCRITMKSSFLYQAIFTWKTALASESITRVSLRKHLKVTSKAIQNRSKASQRTLKSKTNQQTQIRKSKLRANPSFSLRSRTVSTNEVTSNSTSSQTVYSTSSSRKKPCSLTVSSP